MDPINLIRIHNRNQDIARGLLKKDPTVVKAFFTRHDASNAMFDRLHAAIREGKVNGKAEVAIWLENEKKLLPPEVDLVNNRIINNEEIS